MSREGHYRQNSQMSQVWVPDPSETNLIDNSPPKPKKCGILLNRFRIQTSVDDIRSVVFWKALFAEFAGTFFLVLIGVGSTVQGWRKDPLDIVQIAFTFGLCVTIVVWIIGHISGGHINPAVTVAMFVTRRISLIKAVLYIIFQCAGAVAGAGMLRSLTPVVQQGGLGTTTLSEGVSPGMGLGIEFFITMLLVLTVFATCDNKRKDHEGSFQLTIGLAVAVGHLWAVEFCGSSMNPARSFGPAVVMNIWDNHWVYWVGPLAGGITAGFLYDIVLASNASLVKARDCLLTSRFDDDAYPARKAVIKILEEEYQACKTAEPVPGVSTET